MRLKSLFKIKSQVQTGDFLYKNINILGFKIKQLDLKKELQSRAQKSNNNLVQLVYLQLKHAASDDFFCLKNRFVNYIFSSECKNLEYAFFRDYVLPNGYTGKLLEFNILDKSSELYKEHIIRKEKGEFLWKYADRFGYVEHKFLAHKDGKIIINTLNSDGNILQREYVDGITVDKYLEGKVYSEKCRILKKMFVEIFEKYKAPNEPDKVSYFISDFHLGNIITDKNEKFYFIDYDDRYGKNIELGYCIYYSLYFYDKNLYREMLKIFNCEEKSKFYAKEYNPSKVHMHIINKSDRRSYLEQKTKFF